MAKDTFPTDILTFDTWEKANTVNYKHSIYLPSSRARVAAGSFIIYGSGNGYRRVGRLLQVRKALEIVNEFGDIPAGKYHYETELCQVNLFWETNNGFDQNKRMFNEPLNNNGAMSKCTELFQSKGYQWVKTVKVQEICFVFHYNDVVDGKYEILFMDKAFFVRYRVDHNCSPMKRDSIESKSCTFQFPSDNEEYKEYLATKCYAKTIWMSIIQIRKAFLSLLCRAPMNQSLSHTVNIWLFPEAWDYLKEKLTNWQHCYSLERYCKRVRLTYGLQFFAVKEEVSFEVIRTTTKAQLDRLHSYLGGVCIGVGLRKQRPNYNATPAQRAFRLNDMLHMLELPDVNDSDYDAGKDYVMRERNNMNCIEFTYNVETSELSIFAHFTPVVATTEVLTMLQELGVINPEKQLQREEEAIAIEYGAMFAYRARDGRKYLYTVEHVHGNPPTHVDAERMFLFNDDETTVAVQGTVVDCFRNIREVQHAIDIFNQ